MRAALTFFAVLALSGLALSQDLKIREEAVRLLERANAVSANGDLRLRESSVPSQSAIALAR